MLAVIRLVLWNFDTFITKKHHVVYSQALSGSLASKLGTPDEDEELGYCIAVVQSVQTEPAVRTVIDESLRLLSSKVSAV